MKLTLHHINLATENVDRMDRFYRDVLGLERETSGLPTLEKSRGYAGDVAVVTDGAIQTHLAQRDMQAGFATGQIVNPVSHGTRSSSTILTAMSSKCTKSIPDAGFPSARC